MAVIIATGFEDYTADQAHPNRNASLLAAGWTTGSNLLGVVSSGAHTGTNSVRFDNGALQWEPGYLGPSVTMEAWFSCDVPSFGQSMQISSLTGTDGLDRWTLQLVRDDTSSDLVLFVFDVEMGRASNVLLTSTYQKLTLEVRFSSVNDTGDDVNFDGCVRAYVDDVLVISVTAARVAVSSMNWATDENYWDLLYWNCIDGNIDDVRATDDVLTCPSPGGNMSCGDRATVVGPRTVLFSLNGSPNTNNTPGLFKIAGNLEVTGTTTFGVSSDRLDGLGT